MSRVRAFLTNRYPLYILLPVQDQKDLEIRSKEEESDNDRGRGSCRQWWLGRELPTTVFERNGKRGRLKGEEWVRG